MSGYLERIREMERQRRFSPPVDAITGDYELDEINERSRLGGDDGTNGTPSLFDLPFPIGYGGLPMGQVEIAERVNDRLSITDPVLRKYNVMSHVRGYYFDLEGSSGEHYRAVAEEQERLGQILDSDTPRRMPLVIDSPTVAYLLERLRKGLTWLTTTFNEWDSPTITTTAKVDRFFKGLDTWVELEGLLRSTHDYKGCVMGDGERCPDESPVSCDWCCKQRTHKGDVA